jgi:hypothetical protein
MGRVWLSNVPAKTRWSGRLRRLSAAPGAAKRSARQTPPSSASPVEIFAGAGSASFTVLSASRTTLQLCPLESESNCAPVAFVAARRTPAPRSSSQAKVSRTTLCMALLKHLLCHISGTLAAIFGSSLFSVGGRPTLHFRIAHPSEIARCHIWGANVRSKKSAFAREAVKAVHRKRPPRA